MDIGQLDFDLPLTETQVGNLCDAVRSKAKGLMTETGCHFWRYEEYILEYMKVDVAHPQAQEVIKHFLNTNYSKIYCGSYQHHREGGLLQQFITTRWEDGLCEFLTLNEIDPLTIRDREGVLIIPWIEGELNKNISATAFVRFFEDALKFLQMSPPCRDDFFDD